MLKTLLKTLNQSYFLLLRDYYIDAVKNFSSLLTLSIERYQLPHISQFEALLELSKTYVSVAKYDSAEYYVGLATYIYNNVYEQNRSHYDSTAYNWNVSYMRFNGIQSTLLHRKGQIEQAIAVLETQLREIQRLYPDEFEILPEYAITISNLSVYYNEIGYHEYAKSYALQYDRLITENDDVLDRIHSLQNLGSTYRNMERDSAAYYWKKAIELTSNSSYKNQYIHAVILNNLGELALEQEQYDSAIYFLQESIKIQESKQAINPRLHRTTLLNFAESYRWQGNYPKADTIFRTLIDDIIFDIAYNFTYLSDNEKMAFYNAQIGVIDTYTSFALELSGLLPLQGTDSPYLPDDIIGRLYDLQLQTKATILNASKRMKQQIMASGDTTMIHIYHLWEQRKNDLASALLSGELTDEALEQLKIKIEENEKWLTTNSRSFKSGFVCENTRWQEVQQALQPGEAAVEIVRFLDGLIYGALIITPETIEQPVMALMMSTKSKHLERQFYDRYRNSITYKLVDTLSYDTYWKPIKEKLLQLSPNGKIPHRVYLSNDGIYNQINLNTLNNPVNGQYILDETDIVILTNTKDLLKPTRTNRKKNAILFGQPAFSSTSNSTNVFSPLPETGKEVELISQILKKAGWKTEVFLGTDATEKQLKTMATGQILHLASHGFFEKKEDTEPNMASAMVQSGIALAGANDTDKRDEDGLLTAFEVLSMDLDSTQLVVLSACETGQGNLRRSEGIYGLQRAVRVAGASNMIISLWKVDDTATQELMVAFYLNWVFSKDIHAAFRAAQQTLRIKYSEPYYWGAFVLSGK